MTSLRDRRVLVAGGTGDVDEGVVRVLLAHGATVIVPVRTREKGNRLREALAEHAALELIDGKPCNVTAAMALARRVSEGGPLVIAALVATRSRAADASTEVSAEEIGTLAATLIARGNEEAPFVSRLPATRPADRV